MYARFYGILNFAKTGVTGYFNLLPLLNEQKNPPQKKWRFTFHVNWNDLRLLYCGRCEAYEMNSRCWRHEVRAGIFSDHGKNKFFVCESDASVTHMHVHERRIFFLKSNLIPILFWNFNEFCSKHLILLELRTFWSLREGRSYAKVPP